MVQSLDRFGVRDAWELGKFFTILKDHNCRLLDASGKQLNADDDGTVITSTVGALTSSREQKEKAGRVLTGKVTLARKGNFLGRLLPLRLRCRRLRHAGQRGLALRHRRPRQAGQGLSRWSSGAIRRAEEPAAQGPP